MLLYTYISRFSVNPHYQQMRKIQRNCHRNSVPNRSSLRFSTSRTNGSHSLSRAKAGTHRLSEKNRTQRSTRRNRGAFRMGGYHYPRTVPHVLETLGGQGVERQTLPLLGLDRVYFRRPQKACGTAMRSCASLSRGVAAPLGCAVLMPLFVQYDLEG